MTGLEWQEHPIGRAHDRKSFDCGIADLNIYLRKFARQNHQSGGAKTFIASPMENPSRVLGFYSLSPVSLHYERSPAILRKGLARHEVPLFRLGRLAVDLSLQGSGLGGSLLIAAGKRCIRVAQEVGGVGLFIDAKDEQAANWYQTYGAVPLDDAPLSLVLPFATLSRAFEIADQVRK